MTLALRGLLLIAVPAMLAACSPQPPAGPKPIESPPPPQQGAQEENHFPDGDPTPFMGRWRQSAVVVAPWAKPTDSKEPNPEFAEVDTVFMPTSASGPGIVTCEKATWAVKSLPVEGLFEGNLPDPWEDAKKLGVTAAISTVLHQGCASSTGDLELQFVKVDDDTLLLGLDNMIYTLKRQPDGPPPMHATPPPL